ncbi:hypothetical protein [Lysobacter sp. GCM10012299]
MNSAVAIHPSVDQGVRKGGASDFAGGSANSGWSRTTACHRH